jgi:signal transduction histidine kinase
MRSRLRFRLFVWFGITIAISLTVAGGVAGAVTGGARTLALLSAGGLLWAGSGAIAWRLTHPLARLVRTAREIGEGKFDRRVDLGPRRGELGILADAMNEMAARIEQQIADQRALLAAVSHEIRTPLGHLRILAETARERGLEARVAEEIERELLEIDDLVGQLLAGSRLDFQAVERRPLDAADAATLALERAGLPATLLAIESSEVACRADPTLVARALANLLANAEGHGGGARRLVVARQGDALLFAVEDDGPGFAPEELERVFDRFYRGAARGEPRSGSLGLGLALVKRIAEAHGGRAFAENRPQGGARVGFTVGNWVTE